MKKEIYQKPVSELQIFAQMPVYTTSYGGGYNGNDTNTDIDKGDLDNIF